MRTKTRIAYIISHPIQHFCPMFKEWAKSDDWELTVFFASSAGSNTYYDPNFGKEVSWQGLYLDEFDHVFLDERSVNASSALDAPNLHSTLDRYKPDVLIILGYNQKYQRRALKWGRKNRKKIIMFSDSELRQPRAIYKNILKKLFLPGFLKKVDAYLVTGNANEEYYMHYGVPAHKFFRSSYPIDTVVYEAAFQRKQELRAQKRAELHLEEHELVYTIVGKFVPWKSQVDLIRSLAHIRNTSTRLLLIGSGEYEAKLRNEAKAFGDKVIFAGFVPPGELPAYYAATDVYVHPSFIEPHSVAISEAVYMGCPVIVSHTSGSYGTMDDVQNGVNGFIYQHGDLQALARLVDRLTDKELRDSFGAASRQYAVHSQQSAKGNGLRAALLALEVD
jgi:glycosyltransferase involved in cell wall biosynthesis